MTVLKTICVVVVLLMAMPLHLIAQYLNKIYDYSNSGDWGYTAFVESSGDYFIIGSGMTSTWHLMSKRIDASGIELLNKTVISSNGCDYFRGNPGAIRRNAGGNYIVPITLSRASGSGFINFAGLAIVGPNGDSLWMKVLTDTMVWNNEFANDCNLMPDGGYILASRNGNIVNSDGVLRRTDNSGNVLWSKTHISDGFITCEYIGDGKIVVGGMSTSLKWITGSSFYYPSRPRFLLYDTLGNLLRDTLYGTKYVGGGRIYKDNNGGFFHWGTLDSLLHPNEPEDINNFPDYVAHLDDNFRVVWLKNFATKKWDKRTIWNVRQLKDGNYLLLGQQSDTSLLPDEPVDQGWAMKLDKNGFVMWDNHYYFDLLNPPHYLLDAAERPDGSIVMTGMVGDNGISHGQDLWVVVVDSNGCIIPNCSPTVVESLEHNQDLQIYPNPTNGRFSVRAKVAGKITVSNAQGFPIGRFDVIAGHNGYDLPSTLHQGIYFCTFQSASSSQKSTYRILFTP